MTALRIKVDGATIYGRGSEMPRRSGMIVKPGGFQGWQGLPVGRREALARAVQHGEFDTQVYLPSRVVTVDAWIVADSEYELGNLIDRAVGIGATGDLRSVSVSMYGSTLYANGRRMLAEAQDTGHRDDGSYLGEMQLQLLFPDPRKYGDENRSPKSGTATTIEVVSYGTFPAYSVVEIPNAPSSYTITSPAGQFVVTGAVAGGTHRVYLRSGKVTRNGVEMVNVGHGDLWTDPPRPGWVYTLSAPGAVFTRDTRI